LEPSGLSSPIIQLLSTVMYLSSHRQFNHVHKHDGIHISMLQKFNPKLARV
jgi:hypothetical protein